MNPICRLICMGLLVAGVLVVASADDPDWRGATVDPGKPLLVTGDVRDQVRREPLDVPWITARRRADDVRLEGYVLVDSLHSQLFVPPGEEQVIFFDYGDASVRDTLLSYALTSGARVAIAAAPVWLRMDLENNFRRLTEYHQDRYASLLLGAAGTNIVDEVAFQLAHLSWTVLSDSDWDETLLVNNANLMYQIALELQYVSIVDYDVGSQDEYSTTSYVTIVDGDTTQVEIPREVYYWWIVMPKVSDEKPLQDETVYGYFWREYLCNHHDDGYPLLQEVMEPLTVLWDGERHDWGGGRPFSDFMLAVDAIGNWCSETVPDAAWGNRPIQPNVIAHEHNGNCGELQDLLCAAARACLVPAVCTMDILEDHVWCEMWWDGIWHPYQVDLGHGGTHIANPGIAYDRDHGGSKDCSCIWDWRNDGFTWDAIATYSEVCTLTVYIDDPNGIPVDNASVMIGSEGYYPPYAVGAGTWGETGQNGTIQFLLGDAQNYYVRVITSLGHSGGYSLLISNSEAGEHYYWNWTTSGEMRQLVMVEEAPAPFSPFVIEVEYWLPYDLKYGKDTYGPVNFYSEKIPDGRLDFFVADRTNFEAYLAGEPLAAYAIAEGYSSNHVLFNVPGEEDYFIVLSGAEHHGLSTHSEVVVRVWQQHPAATPHGAPSVVLLNPAPNPFRDRTRFALTLPQRGKAAIRVYDAMGRLVRTIVDGYLDEGEHQVTWDGADEFGRQQPSGQYFLQLERAAGCEARRVLLMR